MNAYDQVGYINHPYSSTHPSHLAVLARLHGLDPAPVETARVLDIGTNEGGNLIPLAMVLPEAELVGMDLAAAPIQRGQEIVESLALKNVRMLQKNLLDVDADFGKFDYIIAHGLYAWTPPEVGDKLLAVARANLSPRGIAFVSYNTQPGGHLRKLLRDMMLFHADRFEAPADRLIAARAVLALIGEGWPQANAIEQAVAAQAREVMERTDSSLYHDYLAPVFEPVYFRDFVRHAVRHGLTYVADASVSDTYNLKISPQMLEAVRAAAPGGHLFQEQFLDLLRIRRFRRSLICHAEQKPVPGWDPARAVGLHASSDPNKVDGEIGDSTAAEFLRELGALWPASRPLVTGDTERALELYRRDLIDLNAFPSRAVRGGDKPLASPLVRLQAARGDSTISTLRHHALAVDDAEGRRMLTLLDGSRDRQELAAEMHCSREQMDAQLLTLERHAIFLA